VSFVELFSPCLVNVLIRRTYFVMPVVNLPQVADKIHYPYSEEGLWITFWL